VLLIGLSGKENSSSIRDQPSGELWHLCDQKARNTLGLEFLIQREGIRAEAIKQILCHGETERVIVSRYRSFQGRRTHVAGTPQLIPLKKGHEFSLTQGME
jgi:hypothetical protein